MLRFNAAREAPPVQEPEDETGGNRSHIIADRKLRSQQFPAAHGKRRLVDGKTYRAIQNAADPAATQYQSLSTRAAKAKRRLQATRAVSSPTTISSGLLKTRHESAQESGAERAVKSVQRRLVPWLPSAGGLRKQAAKRRGARSTRPRGVPIKSFSSRPRKPRLPVPGFEGLGPNRPIIRV